LQNFGNFYITSTNFGNLWYDQNWYTKSVSIAFEVDKFKFFNNNFLNTHCGVIIFAQCGVSKFAQCGVFNFARYGVLNSALVGAGDSSIIFRDCPIKITSVQSYLCQMDNKEVCQNNCVTILYKSSTTITHLFEWLKDDCIPLNEHISIIHVHGLRFILKLYFEIIYHIISLNILVHQHYSTKEVCKRIHLLSMQFLYRKHDFVVLFFRHLLLNTLFDNGMILVRCMYNIYIYLFVVLNSWRMKMCFINSRYPRQTGAIIDMKIIYENSIVGGGSNRFYFKELYPYMINSKIQNNRLQFIFNKYVLYSDLNRISDTIESICVCDIPWTNLLFKLSVAELKSIAVCHNIPVSLKLNKLAIRSLMFNHVCRGCERYVSIFSVFKGVEQKRMRNLEAVKKYQKSKGELFKQANLIAVQKHQRKKLEKNNVISTNHACKINFKNNNIISARKYYKPRGLYHRLNYSKIMLKQHIKKTDVDFPPVPPTLELQHMIITNACKDMAPSQLAESGCTVCGKLTTENNLLKMGDLDLDLSPLYSAQATQKERLCSSDSIQGLDGPVLLNNVDKICVICHKDLSKGKLPKLALANGKWLGDIPKELSDLSFVEKLLIARVRHNRCIVRVSSGMHKMRANAIAFANPTLKIYHILPPPIEELDDVLAFIYTGPCLPTKADFKRTPLLVRRNKVRIALDWLKLNHIDYYDLEISQKNLDAYPEDTPPVVVDYCKSFENKDPESTATYDNEIEEGTDSGECPFVVHGITGDEYSNMSTKALKAIALKHLTSNRKILAVGHKAQAENTYNNPQLFPQMMPWLFPYGFGGIGNKLQQGRISDIAHKRYLLMYHDKRFQKDPYFPLIAFNHEQMKESWTGGYLLANKSKFDDISKRLLDVDLSVLSTLASRLEKGDRVNPSTDKEKACFQLIKDLDHAGSHVKGSITNKKYMRNEIWSLISFVGAPSWFITFSPADNKHPISLYYAGTQETFKPDIKDYNERYRLIAQNPVAGARFFHFMCELFIKHVLGVGANHPGLYGTTEAFYGIVEQQGRLTLHLHLLLWILGALSPQDIRDKIMDPNSDFQQRIIQYLEGVHIGEFMTGTMTELKEYVKYNEDHNRNYEDPTQTLPDPPPSFCGLQHEDCVDCENIETWWNKFKQTVDDIMFRSNVHNCDRNNKQSGDLHVKKPTCINKYGVCKARFFRQIFNESQIDIQTGALNIKKGEAWINFVTPVLTYLLRCNTDVTSLLSGTAIKAVVAYVSDYIAKPGLRTYSIFNTIKSVFSRNSDTLHSNSDRREKARKLITQITNALTAKLEIGSPMASLYLLGYPDHYKSHDFNHVYWRNYVNEVLDAWRLQNNLIEDNNDEKVMLYKQGDKYIAYSSVHDYIYRPKIHNDVTLYEWMQMAKRIKRPLKDKENRKSIATNDTDIMESILDHNKIHKTNQYITENFEDEDSLSFIEDDFIESDNDQYDDYDEKSDICNNDSDDDISLAQEFLEMHPLYDTHLAHFNPKKIRTVPDFIGGSLPRRDRGDRDYYCTTMLTLFKPWRNGRDLKNENESWDEAFSNYVFTSCQVQLMNYFNLRYECLDARDDFSAQLKKGKELNGIYPHWLSGNTADDMGEIDQDDFDDNVDFVQDIDSDGSFSVNPYSTYGRNGLIIKAQMEAAEICMNNSGWLEKSPDGLLPIDTHAFKPDLVQSAIKWKAVVQQKKVDIITERNQHGDSRNVRYQQQDPNAYDVKIIDQSYLTSTFKAKKIEIQREIDCIVQDFHLNKEQERAFRIISNHAVSSKGEQLKMYIGGMGGTGKSQVIKAVLFLF